jgi:hypothetical protein
VPDGERLGLAAPSWRTSNSGPMHCVGGARRDEKVFPPPEVTASYRPGGHGAEKCCPRLRQDGAGPGHPYCTELRGRGRAASGHHGDRETSRKREAHGTSLESIRVKASRSIRKTLPAWARANEHRPQRNISNDLDGFCEALRKSCSMSAAISKIEHNAPHVRSNVLLVETKLCTHLQHGRIFGQHIAVHAP